MELLTKLTNSTAVLTIYTTFFTIQLHFYLSMALRSMQSNAQCDENFITKLNARQKLNYLIQTET